MNLTLLLLAALDRVHPHLAREEVLALEVNAWLPRPASLTEVRRALRQFEREGWAVTARAPAGHQLWKITAAGRAALAEMELGA
ncbi:hypothetical protein NXS98_14035 [Fontisphaera persica]|uniref:hypothetical protein n=1 Tax=Fontisphaera persica TaxID=2974023 RepID=UPI0024BFCF0F|nr:hypothetical protein [Fontisphaera persica]WCJ58827.1 hypothetical protein NXS98_14035 [Fontisphaera persica]